jgi:hypothetical protein
MAKIQIQTDCGNAPRKLFLKELNIAFANGDFDYIITIIQEEITWDIVGYKRINGKEAYLNELTRHKLWKVQQLIIDKIITHGPDASVSGEIITTDNKKFAFLYIYRFKGAGGTTINAIKTFMIVE